MCAHPKWTCAHPRSLTCASLTHHGEEIAENACAKARIPTGCGRISRVTRTISGRDIHPHPAGKRAHARAGHTYTQAAEGISQGRRNAVPPDTPRFLSKKKRLSREDSGKILFCEAAEFRRPDKGGQMGDNKNIHTATHIENPR